MQDTTTQLAEGLSMLVRWESMLVVLSVGCDDDEATIQL